MKGHISTGITLPSNCRIGLQTWSPNTVRILASTTELTPERRTLAPTPEIFGQQDPPICAPLISKTLCTVYQPQLHLKWKQVQTYLSTRITLVGWKSQPSERLHPTALSEDSGIGNWTGREGQQWFTATRNNSFFFFRNNLFLKWPSQDLYPPEFRIPSELDLGFN